jgi:hypothetical protein
MREKLGRADYTFLKLVNFKDKNLKLEEVLKLGDEAPYFMAQICDRTDRGDIGLRLLTLGWQKENRWTGECGLLLFQKLVKKDDFASIKTLFADSLSRFRNPENLKAARRLHVESVYWEKKDESVLSLLSEYGKEYPDWAQDPELKLFKAVAACRLDKDYWSELFAGLFLNDAGTTVHKRAYDFLMLDETRSRAFSKPLWDLVQARSLIVTGKQAEAIPLLEQSLSSLDLKPWSVSPLLLELNAAYIAAVQYKAGSVFLEKLSGKLNAADRLTAVEMSARLNRLLKNYAAGIAQLEKIIPEVKDIKRKERIIWFILDMAYGSKPDLYRKKLGLYMDSMVNKDYFEDLFVNEIHECMVKKQWQKIWEIYPLISPVSTEEVTSKLCYIILRLLDKGLLKLGVAENQAFRDFVKREIASRCSIDYYVLLLSIMLNTENCLFSLIRSNEGEEKTGGSPPPPDAEAELINLRMDYGFFDEAYELAIGKRNTLARDTLVAIGKRFNALKRYKESIRLMDALLWRTSDLSLTKEELKYLFPLAWYDEIRKGAQAENIPVIPFLALIKEESYFDPEIVSRSGAVGLTRRRSPRNGSASKIPI